jgi:hypothetical protein
MSSEWRQITRLLKQLLAIDVHELVADVLPKMDKTQYSNESLRRPSSQYEHLNFSLAFEMSRM